MGASYILSFRLQVRNRYQTGYPRSYLAPGISSVAEILRSSDLQMLRQLSTPTATQKLLFKDEATQPDIMVAVSSVPPCSRFQVTSKSPTLSAAQEIFSDYAGANLDSEIHNKKVVNFLAGDLFPWQCKK
ncbi:hypothetical protein Tco_0898928 [Tanacetum coccineum]